MEVSKNSLGRKTIASLQEIERNRQIHLAKQGMFVYGRYTAFLMYLEVNYYNCPI